MPKKLLLLLIPLLFGCSVFDCQAYDSAKYLNYLQGKSNKNESAEIRKKIVTLIGVGLAMGTIG